MIKLTINNQEIIAKPGEKILWVALDNKIYIPNLCAIREKETPNATCRLCFVEIELNKERRIVTACSEAVKEGMKVYTTTERVRRLQRTAFELLMSEHQVNCSDCWARKRCELLKIAAYLKLKITTKRFRKIDKNFKVDTSLPSFILDPNKCVKCARCIYIGEKLKKKELNFAYRGIDICISSFDNIPLQDVDKDVLEACAAVCPTGALVRKN